ncbi:hypothetical protein [Streptomyces sp. NPDC007074]|uniref:hypothetical protein n=1 Tax=Streptomyces sp. NPDC007074 TaxID=3156764 RepID=UPI0033CA8319
MHDASRPARHVTGGRRRATGAAAVLSAVAVLSALLLALFTTVTVSGPPTGRTGQVGDGATVAGLPARTGDATDDRPGAVPLAHEECAAVCSVRAGGRSASGAERPAPPVHQATTADTAAVPAPAPVPTPPGTASAHRSPGLPVPDRGRAPPGPSGS